MPHLGSTMELSLLEGKQVSQSHVYRHGRTDSITWSEVALVSLPLHPLHLATCICGSQEGWPEVLRTGELALLLTSCSTQENQPCILPGQYSRAGAKAWLQMRRSDPAS